MPESSVKKFLNKKSPPFLLALSGGVDSLALFLALCKLKTPFAALYVDHGWRKESKDEAIALKALCQQHGVPFHLETIDPPVVDEAACRLARLHCFKKIIDSKGYNAVLLGHHKDDLAETVLKRVFEGARLEKLVAMREESVWEGIVLLRPFLTLSKSDLAAFVDKHPYFEDKTNVDPRFLRSRMRQTLIPSLEAAFGKAIAEPLAALSKEAAELTLWLDEEVAKFPQVHGIFGTYVDISSAKVPIFLMKRLISRVLEHEGLQVRKRDLDTLADWVKSLKANLWFNDRIFVDRGLVFALNQEPRDPNRWKITVTDAVDDDQVTSWKELWQGRGVGRVPSCEIEAKVAARFEPYPGKQPLGKWLQESKVPALFFPFAPSCFQNGRIVHEFLTGKESKGTLKKMKVAVEYQSEPML